MVLKSNLGLKGDQSLLISKMNKYTEGRQISFDAYFNPPDNDSLAMLKLEASHYGVKRIPIDVIPRKPRWQRLTFDVPPGEYKFIFRGNMGQQFSNDIAVANVDLKDTSEIEAESIRSSMILQ